MERRFRSRARWTQGLPVHDRGPGESFRPDDVAPSVTAAHQSGIATPILDHLQFAALDIAGGSLSDVRDLVGELTLQADGLMRARHRRSGAPAGTLTVTVGLGRSLFDDRFVLAAARPVALVELPAFGGDRLDLQRCGGDLGVQICADSPDSAADALQRLTDVAAPVARVRWTQRAAMHRSPLDPPRGRPRNLLGFKDATANPRRGKDLDRHVWVTGRERTWMLGGTFLVVRGIRVLLDRWEALSLPEQERVIGRHRDSGAPLGASHEFGRMPDDDDVVAPHAHARVASPQANGGATVLRRGYSFDNGRDRYGQHDAGMFLLLYGSDPRRQFIPLQRRLAEHDSLTRYTRTVTNAIFAIPPGTRPGQPLGNALFES